MSSIGSWYVSLPGLRLGPDVVSEPERPISELQTNVQTREASGGRRGGTTSRSKGLSGPARAATVGREKSLFENGTSATPGAAHVQPQSSQEGGQPSSPPSWSWSARSSAASACPAAATTSSTTASHGQSSSHAASNSTISSMAWPTPSCEQTSTPKNAQTTMDRSSCLWGLLVTWLRYIRLVKTVKMR